MMWISIELPKLFKILRPGDNNRQLGTIVHSS